jgi:hypothetical protein
MAASQRTPGPPDAEARRRPVSRPQDRPRAPVSVKRGTRSLFGLRVRPRRLALAVFRLPLPLYRRGWGSLRPHVPAARPRRPQERHDLLLGRHGLDLRSGHSRGGHLLGLGRPCGLGAQHPSATCAPSPDRTGVVHPRAALPHRGRTLRRGRRVPTPPPMAAAVAHAIFGWGDLRSDSAVRDFVRTRAFVALRPAAASRR